ncbi:MAG: PAS domain-containing protein, partial [Thermomicrobiales bacterium]
MTELIQAPKHRGYWSARWLDYLIALAVACLTVAIRAALDPLLGDDHPFIIPILGVVFVAWIAGFGPALLTLVASMGAVTYLFFPERYTFRIVGLPNQLGTGLFFLIGLGCALLGQAQRSARWRAEIALGEALRRRADLEAEITLRAEVERFLRERENELLRLNAELRDSEERFRFLAQAVPQIVWITRPDGYHEYYNGRWYDYTGLTPEESIGYGWSKPLHPDDLERSKLRWEQSTNTGEEYEIEYRFRRSDGEYRWFLGRALPVRDETGQIVRWFGTCTDIDDKKRQAETLENLILERTLKLREEIEERIAAEKKVAEMVTELRRSNGELEQFAYVASHDLQEPLRKIQAFGDRLTVRCREILDDQGRDYIDRMQSSAARMQQLINDLLVYSRVSTRGQQIRMVDLNETAQNVASDLEGRILQAGSGARVDIGPMPTVPADALQMRQLLQKLIGNALKFSRPNVPALVTVSARLIDGDDGQKCRIEVADNGIGFDEQYLDRIFQVFQRLHGRGTYEGTGVGLAICRK